jgi:tight adherence protein B
MTTTFFIPLLIGIASVLTGLIVVLSLVYSLSSGSDLSERLEVYALIHDKTPRRDYRPIRKRVARLRTRMNSMLSAFTSEELSLRLMSANWPITETEYILIRIWGTVAGFVIGWALFQSIYPGIGLAVIALLTPSIYLNTSVNRRRLKFEKQLVDVLVLITGAVRAGYSFLQSLDIVVQEMKPPVSEEFRRVRQEVGLGLSLGQALTNLHARMQNEDLYLVISAVNINSQVGGNLTTMLEAVTNTVRERSRLFSEIRALTSQQRFSGYILTLLPFIIVAILFIISPNYISKLFQPGAMMCIPIGALVFVLLGNIVIRMMSKMDV